MGQEISCGCKPQEKGCECKLESTCCTKNGKQLALEKDTATDTAPVVFDENPPPEDVDLRFLMPPDLMLERARTHAKRDIAEQSTKSSSCRYHSSPSASRQLPRTLTADLTPSARSQPREIQRASTADLPSISRHQISRTFTPDITPNASRHLALSHSLTPGSSKQLSRTLTPEMSRQLMRQDSKNLRGNAIGYFEVDTEIVRGVSLRQTLREAAAIWLRTPATMKEEEKAALYERSQPVQHFDMFLSHTWSTPGKWKAFALLFRTGWTSMLVSGVLAACVAAWLCIVEALPLLLEYEPSSIDAPKTSKLGCWLIMASMIGSLAGLMVSPFLPSRWGNSCFLDVVSVHQSDQQLNERGIYGIGGFLAVSREMQVLWSKPYLSRLWCVFELAAYRTANPEGKITLAPLYVEQIVAVLLFMCYAMSLTFVFTRALAEDGLRTGVFAAAVLPALLATHMLRRFFQDRQKLVADLGTFDLDHVGCQNDFDREFIHTAILKWYGSKDAFRDFVQGPLKKELIAKGCQIHLSGPYLALLVVASTTAALEFSLGLYCSGAPWNSILANVIAGVVGFSVCWTIFSGRVLLYFCDIGAKPIFSHSFDWLQTLLVFAIFAQIWSAGGVLATITQMHGLEAVFAWLCFAAALMALSFTNPRACLRRCRSGNTVQQKSEPPEFSQKV